MGRWQDALATLRQLPTNANSRVRVRDLLAETDILAALGRFSEARRVWREASQVNAAGTGLEFEVAHSEAILAVFEGKSELAQSMLRRLTASDRIDSALKLSVGLWECTAAAWGPAPARADEPCQKVLQAARVNNLEFIRLMATLRLAEARLRLGAREAATELAAEAKQRMKDWGPSSEWLWRAEAIATGSLAPFPAISRLNLGEDARIWSSRPDIARLARLGQK